MANAATHRQIAVVLEELSQEVEALGGALCVDMDIAFSGAHSLVGLILKGFWPESEQNSMTTANHLEL